MRSRSIRINELRLRVPGLTTTDARRLGESVAQQLAANPGALQSRSIPAIGVRIRSSGTQTVERLAETIASRIRSK